MLKFFSVSSWFFISTSRSVLYFTQNRPLVALLDRRVAKVLDRSPQIDNRFQCWWFFCKHVYYDVFVSCNDQHCVLIPVHWKYHLPMQRTKADSFCHLKSPPYADVWYDMIWYDMIWYDMICLLTAIGLTPSGSSTVHIYTQTVHRTTQLTNWEECGLCTIFASYNQAFALQLRKKHRKTSVSGSGPVVNTDSVTVFYPAVWIWHEPLSYPTL
jgi:hypothetical protein